MTKVIFGKDGKIDEIDGSADDVLDILDKLNKHKEKRIDYENFD